MAAPAFYVLVWNVPYRRARITAFLDPYSDPLGSGFQEIQSLIARIDIPVRQVLPDLAVLGIAQKQPRTLQ